MHEYDLYCFLSLLCAAWMFLPWIFASRDAKPRVWRSARWCILIPLVCASFFGAVVCINYIKGDVSEIWFAEMQDIKVGEERGENSDGSYTISKTYEAGCVIYLKDGILNTIYYGLNTKSIAEFPGKTCMESINIIKEENNIVGLSTIIRDTVQLQLQLSETQ